jgi:nitrogen fixation/metabolism regulation signal transduction histidine kinase
MPFRRSVFLINRRFQLLFALYVCTWIFALSLVYPMIIYNLFEFFARTGNLAAADSSKMQDTRRQLIILLAALQALFLGVTFLISIFTAHRIAGPLYKLRKFLDAARNGNMHQDLHFRKSDHFPELAEGFNGMLHQFRSMLGKNFESSSLAVTEIEKAMAHTDEAGKESLDKALVSLRKIQEYVPD